MANRPHRTFWTLGTSVALVWVSVASGFESKLDWDGRREWTIENPAPAVTPTIYVVGLPDRAVNPVRKTKGLTINGIRLTETALSESVLILRPDGTGSWGYQPGFDFFREPQITDGRNVDPRTLIEYDKWRYDPLRPIRCVGGGVNLCALEGAERPVVYEVAFPPTIRVRSLRFQSNCDQIQTPGVEMRMRLCGDPEGRSTIAQQAIGPDAPLKRPAVQFDGLDHHRLYVELSAKAPKGVPVYLYYTTLSADLDTRELRLPQLATGTNAWRVTDDADGSHRARLVLRWKFQLPPGHRIPPIQEWFPLGIYDGITSRSPHRCEQLFAGMRKHHMNTVYISNGSPAGLERVLPLAEAHGIRLVYQGTSAGALYYLCREGLDGRQRMFESEIAPQAKKWVPKFRGRWGLVGWSLTEEIAADIPRELTPYYALIRGLDPQHPPTVLHNNLPAAKADLETNRPLVVTHDCYPFFWSPRSGPSSPQRSVDYYRRQVSSFYRACREHGASLWMMPQAWGCDEQAVLDPPDFGYRSGMRTPTPGEIKLQGWVAVAEGATGLMYYAAMADEPGEHHLWDAGMTETPNTRAAGELFDQLRRAGPLLCRLERDYQEKDFVTVSNPKVLAHRFVARPGSSLPGRYLVVASLDGFGPQSFDLGLPAGSRVFDLVRRVELTGKLTGHGLSAGEGLFLLIGSSSEYKTACEQMDRGQRLWE